MRSLPVKLGVILIGLVIFGNAEAWGANWKVDTLLSSVN